MLQSGIDLLLAHPMSFGWMIIGTAVGIVFGAIPGLSAAMGIAIFLPITFGLTAVEGMATIVSLYIGGISGGLISAILLKIPGTPSSVATCFDGHPMVEKGQADKALGAGIVFSFWGTMFSIAALVTIAPWLASAAIKFGPHEYFAVTFFSLSLIITLSSSSLRKGLMSGILGVMLSTVGLDQIEGSPRFTFDMSAMRSGFSILPVLVGLYAIAEVLATAEHVDDTDNLQVQSVSMRGFGITMAEFAGQLVNFLRSSLIGLAIGILPGIGGGTSNLVAYSVAKNRSKTPERFGTGILDGVVAPESANNATIGGAMIPLLTLGIPGDVVTSMMLGGLAIHGISPGPLIFQNSGDMMYAIFILLVLSSIAMLALEFLCLKAFIKVLKVPKYYLLPLIIILCGIGAFGLNNRLFDMWAMLLFGIMGFALSKWKYPLPPLVLGFILGGALEVNFRRGLSYSKGDFGEFFTRPISGTIIALTLLFIAISIRKIMGARPRA
ncbi:MAG: tripartite tricarboxylate transporter permease [Planctomycetota bacterium]|jgi:putative tricarboxylic transport membrane protein|nr:tripartite tricarboxylate transporter permease [Planctomycetota bacterium]